MTTTTVRQTDETAAQNVVAALAAAGFDPSTIALALLDPAVYPRTTAVELTRILRAGIAPPLTDAALWAALTGTRYPIPELMAAFRAVTGSRPPRQTKPLLPAAWNTAIGLDGSSYLSAAANPAYNLGTRPFTVEAAVRASAPGTVIARGGGGVGGFRLEILADGAVSFTTEDGATALTCTAPSTVLDGSWHHLSATRDQTGIRMVIDGASSPHGPVTVGDPRNVNSETPLTVGGTGQPGRPVRALTGAVAEVRIWSEIRRPDWSLRDMWSRLYYPEKYLVGHWSGVLGTICDISGTHNPTTGIGAIAVVPGPPKMTSPASGWPIGDYVGSYDLATRGQDGMAWFPLGQLHVCPPNLFIFLGRPVSPRSWDDCSTSWQADRDSGIGGAVVAFMLSGRESDMYWADEMPLEPVVEGTYRPLDGPELHLRGQRRP